MVISACGSISEAGWQKCPKCGSVTRVPVVNGAGAENESTVLTGSGRQPVLKEAGAGDSAKAGISMSVAAAIRRPDEFRRRRFLRLAKPPRLRAPTSDRPPRPTTRSCFCAPMVINSTRRRDCKATRDNVPIAERNFAFRSPRSRTRRVEGATVARRGAVATTGTVARSSSNRRRKTVSRSKRSIWRV